MKFVQNSVKMIHYLFGGISLSCLLFWFHFSGRLLGKLHFGWTDKPGLFYLHIMLNHKENKHVCVIMSN